MLSFLVTVLFSRNVIGKYGVLDTGTSADCQELLNPAVIQFVLHQWSVRIEIKSIEHRILKASVPYGTRPGKLMKKLTTKGLCNKGVKA